MDKKEKRIKQIPSPILGKDDEGNIIWNRPGNQHNAETIAGNVVRQTDDGGFIILYSGDKLLFKTDPNGEINW